MLFKCLSMKTKYPKYPSHILCLFSLLIFTMIAVFVMQYHLFSSFSALPSEHYGGDQYFHLARTLHLYQGKPFYESSNDVNEYEYYPWLTNAMIAALAKLLHISALKATLFFPLFAAVLTSIITFLLAKKLSGDDLLSLLFSLATVTSYVPDAHPSEFAKFTFIPLLIYMLYFFYLKEQNTVKSVIKQSIITGIILGLAGLQHIVSFVFGITLFLFITFLKIFSAKNPEEKNLKKIISQAVCILCIAFLIVLLYGYPLLFIYHGKTLNPWQEWTTPTPYPSLAALFPTSFFSTATVRETLITGTILWGIFFFMYSFIHLFFKEKKYKHFPLILDYLRETKFLLPLLCYGVFVLTTLHPYLTKPLFGFTLGYYRFFIILFFTRYLLAFVSFLFIINILKKQKLFLKIISLQQKRKISINSLFIISLVVVFIPALLVNYHFIIKAYAQSPRVQYAFKEGFLDEYKMFSAFSQQATPEIYTASPVLSMHPYPLFLLNGATGAKVFLTAQTHASPFVDYNKKAAELAVMLYGNDTRERTRLLTTYNITYFVLDGEFREITNNCGRYFIFYNRSQRYSLAEKEEKAKNDEAFFCIRTTPLYKGYLEKNNVAFVEDSIPLAVEKDAPKQELLIVKPKRLQLPLKKLFPETAAKYPAASNMTMDLFFYKIESAES